MQTTLETLGALERRINVALPVAEIEGEVQKRLSRLARTVRVAGFRPGKVPLKMVAQQYGPQVRSDVIAESVQSRFNDAVREQNLRVAGYPRIEPRRADGDAVPEALEFSAVFEVYPEVRVGDVSAVTIERPVASVASADVDRTLDVLRRQRTTFEPVARPAQAGDRVLVDFTGTLDGVEFQGGQARDFPITLGEGRMLPEFESAVTGMRAGESKSFPLTFPADYHGRDVAGRTAEFALTVKQVTEPRLPELDEAFAKSFGIGSGSLSDLRTEVEQNLNLELKRKVEAKVKEQVFKGLREQADFALPRALVEDEARSLMQRMAQNLREQGVKAEDIKLSPEIFVPQAQERVALGLVVAELVRREALQAKPDQVKALVTEAAQTYEQPEAVVRWHYEKPERLAEFEAMAVEKNVVDWVLARARVTDAPTSFEALMAPPAPSEAPAAPPPAANQG
jgi:trigger factor